MDLFELVNREFGLIKNRPEETAPLILAYIGDAVYEVVTRTITISAGNRAAHVVNKENVKYVNAGFQARMADALMESFSDEELAQYKRGRNAKSSSTAKNASVGDYRKATGFEAVIGFLYLKEQNDRIVELCKLGFDILEQGEN